MACGPGGHGLTSSYSTSLLLCPFPGLAAQEGRCWLFPLGSVFLCCPNMQGVPFTTAASAPLPPQSALTSPLSLSSWGLSEVSPRTHPDYDLHSLPWGCRETNARLLLERSCRHGPHRPCREAGVLHCQLPTSGFHFAVCKALLEVERAGIAGGHILPIYRSSERFSNLLKITQLGNSKSCAVSSVKLRLLGPPEERFGQARAGLTFAELLVLEPI